MQVCRKGGGREVRTEFRCGYTPTPLKSWINIPLRLYLVETAEAMLVPSIILACVTRIWCRETIPGSSETTYIVPRLCLSTLGFHGVINTQSSRFFKLPYSQRKFIDWKKTKLFRFRWNWAKEEKVARHPSADSLLHSIGGGWWFCRFCYWGKNAVEREER